MLSSSRPRHSCMKTIEVHHTPYCIVIAPTPEICAADLQEVCVTSRLPICRYPYVPAPPPPAGSIFTVCQTRMLANCRCDGCTSCAGRASTMSRILSPASCTAQPFCSMLILSLGCCCGSRRGCPGENSCCETFENAHMAASQIYTDRQHDGWTGHEHVCLQAPDRHGRCQ